MMSLEGPAVVSSASDPSGESEIGAGVVDLPLNRSSNLPDNGRLTGSGVTIIFNGMVDDEPVLIAFMWLIRASRLGRSVGSL